MTTQDFAGFFTKKSDLPASDSEVNQQSIASAGAMTSELSGVSELDRAVFVETNRLRTNPKSFLPYLKKRLANFKGKTIWMPGVKVGENTEEGPAAVVEAIEFLKKMTPIRELRWSAELAKASRDHVNDQGPKGATGHEGSDGSDPWQRISRYGSKQGMGGENLAYGSKTGVDVVMSLFIDDGVPDRGHRSVLVNDDFGVVGNYSGEHKVYRMMTAQNFAGSFINKGSKTALATAPRKNPSQSVELRMESFMKSF